jgi:hypothetical protein
LDFISKSKLFPQNSVAVHFMIAICDAHHTVVRKGEDEFKKLNKINWEDKEVI